MFFWYNVWVADRLPRKELGKESNSVPQHKKQLARLSNRSVLQFPAADWKVQQFFQNVREVLREFNSTLEKSATLAAKLLAKVACGTYIEPYVYGVLQQQLMYKPLNRRVTFLTTSSGTFPLAWRSWFTIRPTCLAIQCDKTMCSNLFVPAKNTGYIRWKKLMEHSFCERLTLWCT